MKMIGCKIIKGTIRLETGLHIGAGQDVIEIGGVDNPVIRNPITDEPYIPGSSLKGKMRSLAEWYLGKVSANGEVHKCKDPKCKICRVFGTSAAEEKGTQQEQSKNEGELGPTRLIVRDAFLSEESRKEMKEKGIPLTEIKSENTINRITAKANPRHMERAIAGLKFDFEMIYRIFDTSDGDQTDEEYFGVVAQAMKLLENDALGGSGSRGYGKIKFENIKVINEGREEENFGSVDELLKSPKQGSEECVTDTTK